MAPNVVVPANNVVYWMGNDKFYIYSGRVDTLPCTLRQYIFDNINRNQSDIFFLDLMPNLVKLFGSIALKIQLRLTATLSIIIQKTFGTLVTLERTAWIDTGVIDYPVAAKNGYVYLHEYGINDGQPNNAPPLPIPAYIQSADIDIEDGDKYMLIRRIIPDVNFNNSETANR
jgi:hypothetical protein